MTRRNSKNIFGAVFSFLFCLLSLTPLPLAADFVRGDTDSSGAVDISDPVRVLTYLFAGTAEIRCLDAADANDSGNLDIADPIFTLNFLFSGGEDIAAPYPNCGADATPDPLTCESFAGCSTTQEPVDGPQVKNLSANHSQLVRPQGDDVSLVHLDYDYLANGKEIESIFVRSESPDGVEQEDELSDLGAFGIGGKSGKASYQLAFNATSALGTYRYAIAMKDVDGKVGPESAVEIELTPTGAPLIEITEIDPPSGVAGDKVTLFGHRIGESSIERTSVAFAGVPTEIVGMTRDSIVCIVPAGAYAGPVAVATESGVTHSAMEFLVDASLEIALGVDGAVAPGARVELSLQSSGLPDNAVYWYVNKVENGSAELGKIADGFFHAPLDPSVKSVDILAISRFDSSVAAKSTITLGAPPTVIRTGVVEATTGGRVQDEDGLLQLSVRPRSLKESLYMESASLEYLGAEAGFAGIPKGAMPIAFIELAHYKTATLTNPAELEFLLPMWTPPEAVHRVLELKGATLIDTGYRGITTKDGLRVRTEIDRLGQFVVVRTAGAVLNPDFFPPLNAAVVPPPVVNKKGHIEEGMTVPVLIEGKGFFKGNTRVVPVPTHPENRWRLITGPVLVNDQGTKLGFTLQIKSLANLDAGETEPLAFRVERLYPDGVVMNSTLTDPNEFVIAGLPELIVGLNPSSRLFTIDGQHIDATVDGSDPTRYSEVWVQNGAVLGIGRAVGTVSIEGQNFDLSTVRKFEDWFGPLEWNTDDDIRIFQPENHLVALDVTGRVRINGTVHMGGMRGGENPTLQIRNGEGRMGGLAGGTISGGIGGDGGVTLAALITRNGENAGDDLEAFGNGRFGSADGSPGGIASSNVLARGGSRFLPVEVSYTDFVTQIISVGQTAASLFTGGASAIPGLAGSVFGFGQEISNLSTTSNLNGSENLIVAGMGGHGGESGNVAASLSESAGFKIIPNSGGGGGSGGGSSSYEETLFGFTVSSQKEVGGGGGGGGGAAGALRITSGCGVRIGYQGRIEASGGRGGLGEAHQWLGSPGGGGGGGAGGMLKLQGPRIYNCGEIDVSGGARGGSIAGFHGSPTPNGGIGRLQVLDGAQAGGMVFYGSFSDTLHSGLHSAAMKLLWPTGRVRSSTTALPFLSAIRGIGTASPVPNGVLFLTGNYKLILGSRPDYFSGNTSILRRGEVADLNPIVRNMPNTKFVDVCQNPQGSHHYYVAAQTNLGVAILSSILEVDLAGDLVGTVYSFSSGSRTYAIKDIDFLSDGRITMLRPTRFNGVLRGVYAIDVNTGADELIVPDNSATFASMSVLRGEVKDIVHVVQQSVVLGSNLGHRISRYDTNGNRITEAALVHETIGGPGVPGLYRADGNLSQSQRPVVKFDTLTVPGLNLNGSPLTFHAPTIGSFTGVVTDAECFESLVFGTSSVTAYCQGGLQNQTVQLCEKSPQQSVRHTAAGHPNRDGEFTTNVQLDEGYNTLWLQTTDGGDTPKLLRRTVLYIDGASATRPDFDF